jgi:general transcriptional corepressor TUP1
LEYVLRGHEDNIFSMEYSQNGNLLVTGSEDCTLRVWDMRNRRLYRKFAADDRILTISMTSDTICVAAGSADGTIHLWNVETGTKLSKLRAHNNHVCGIQFLPDCMDLVSGSSDGLAKRWIFHPRPGVEEGVGPQFEGRCSTVFKGHQVRLNLTYIAMNISH